MASTNPRNQGRPSGGDYTGRQKAIANDQARKDDQDRSAQTTMATAQEIEDQDVGVFDGKSGQRIDDGSVAIEVEDAEAPEAAFFEFQGAGEPEPVLTGKETPEQLAPVIAARKAFSRPQGQVAPSARQRVRVDQDIEDMTYGMINGEPNNYSFKEGFTYEVPWDVAEHLHNLGLVRQFVSR
jgi:hypothetical protein